MLRKCQQIWRDDITKRHRCMKKFFRTLNEESSKEGYGYKFQKFMRFAVAFHWAKNNEDFDSLLVLDSEKLTDMLEDYVDFLEERGDRNVGTDLAAPELFFQNNRKLWHRELVRGGIKRDKGMPGGELPIEDSELEAVYFGINDLRKKCIISILSSLGIRPGGLVDPVICFKHLIAIENCYAVKIYDQSTYGYWGFLIPEARQDVDNYKEERIRNGENITEDSPILATLASRWNAKHDFITDDNLKEILSKLIRGKVKRKKTGNRYDKALVTMFRKRFNTKLKLNNDVNSNVAELVMAHKLPGSQSNYTKPTMEECFHEIKKAIPELTIDPKKRQRLLIDKQQQEIDVLAKKNLELEAKDEKINLLAEKMRELESNGIVSPDIKEYVENLVLEKMQENIH